MMVLEPRVRQRIEESLDSIVEWAEGCVENTKITESRMEESQLHNLRNLANATDSVKALENFVCYQMGRRPKEWRDTSFGNRVLEDLERLRDLAQEIVEGSDTPQRAVHLELIRIYTGFLYRSFVARRSRGS